MLVSPVLSYAYLKPLACGIFLQHVRGVIQLDPFAYQRRKFEVIFSVTLNFL